MIADTLTMGKLLLFTMVILPCFINAQNIKENKSKHAKVLILGAGASGIRAAETFYRKGMEDFLVLEGKDYIGGRIHHVSFEGSLVPLGAGWIHNLGPDNSIWTLSRKLKMDVHYDNYTDFIVRDANNGEELTGAHTIYEKLKRTLEKAEKKMKIRKNSGKSDIPLDSALGMSGWSPLSYVHKAMEFYHFDFENGISPRVLSGSSYSVTGEGKDVVVTDKRGYAHVLRYLARPFIKKIILNTVVSEIMRTKSGVRVITTNGELYTADYVLVSFSSGVLINNLVKFTPSLPSWKMDAVHLVPMCHYCKVFLKFPKCFWDDKNYILLAQRNRGDHVHWQNFEQPTLFHKQNILLLTLTEDLCLRSEQLSDRDVQIEAMKILKKVYGKDLPQPTAILRNRWNNDPMTMGAYSNPVVGFSQNDYRRLQAPVGRIWFTGEYTTPNYGYVHGAFDIGEQIARNILKHDKSKGRL